MIPLLIILSIGLAILLLRQRPSKDGSVLLEDRFPIWKVDEDCILAKNGDITACFKLTLPEIFSLSNDEYAALHGYWLKAIRLLPAGTVLHKQDWFRQASYKADFGVGSDSHQGLRPAFMKASSERFFNERPYLDHECLLFITLPAKGSRPGSSAASNLFKSSIVATGSADNRHIQARLETVSKFGKILSDSGFVKLTRIRSSEITGTKDAPGLLERYLFLLEKDSSPILKDIQLKPDWKIGGFFRSSLPWPMLRIYLLPAVPK